MTYLQQELDDRVVLEPGAGVVANAAVIWLHGLGADGDHFVPIVPELKLPEGCAPRFVFPHAPVRPVTLNNGMRMRAWYDIVGLSGTAVEDEKGIRQSAALVEQIILREREAGVAAGRIVLAGFSQGGAIALHTALRHPEPRLVCSRSPPSAAASHNRRGVERLRRVPILMRHGVDVHPANPAAERSRDLLAPAVMPWNGSPTRCSTKSALRRSPTARRGWARSLTIAAGHVGVVRPAARVA